MRSLSIFLYEWKHFVRNPFKVVAIVLFALAGIYGLHNGASLYHQQRSEIEKIGEKIEEERQKYMAFYEAGQKGPEDRPWIDLGSPFWALWYNSIYHVKRPSPALVYSIGQAEQYGFYKRVTFRSSTYDADMAEEIANPERLQTGTLDFAFVLLFLCPLLLLLLMYNLKSAEREQGFMPLIEVQTASKNSWMVSRTLFYVALVFIVNLLLLCYGALLTDVFGSAGPAFGKLLLYQFIYLIFWMALFFLILRSSHTIIGSTLKMLGVWLLLAFVIPATVHQWVSIEKPANLMTDFIDATRDDRQALYDLPDSVLLEKLHTLFPEIVESPVAKDSTSVEMAMNRSSAALVNELMKNSIALIESDNLEKNQLIRNTYCFNPIIFFYNQLNAIAQTHYDDYQNYRSEIQELIDAQARTLVLDTWNKVQVDKEKYGEYYQELSQF